MNNRISILHIDDSLMDIELIRDVLEKERTDFTVQAVRNQHDFELSMRKKDYDIVLTDFNILGFDALGILKIVQEYNSDLPVIVVTGTGSEEIAVEAMKRGAADYVIKHPSHIQKLPQTIHAVLERKRLLTEHRKDEELLRLARFSIDNARDAIYWTDGESRFADVNETACRVLEYTREELLQMCVGDIDPNFPPSTWPLHWEELKRLGSIVIETRHRRKSGESFPVELSLNYFTYHDREWNFASARDITDRKKTEEHLNRSVDALRKATGGIIDVVAHAVDIRDPYTSGHQKRVAGLAGAIAEEMGLPPERIEGIRIAGTIHDLGKISIPAEILSMPRKLTNVEFNLVKEHSRIGYDIIKDIEFPWPIARIILQHHERMDGSGYPGNLKGEDSLVEARIIAVADVVESMASHRPYRPALGIDAALAEIENNKGTLYDADAVDACLKLFRGKSFQFEGN